MADAASDIKVRAFDGKSQEDFQRFLELNFRTFWDSIPTDEQPTEAEFRKHHAWLMQRLMPMDSERSRITIAYNSGESYLGHCWLGMQNDFFTNQPTPWIFDITVSEVHRGKGIGKLLLDDCVFFVRQLGLDQLGLQVMGHNESARRFYERYGFTLKASSLRLGI